MTKETIINDLREIGKTNSVSSYKRMVCEMAADTIENQAKALHALTLANVALKEKCRWIPVEERLPENWQKPDGETLVNYMIYSPDFGVDIGNFHAKAKRWICMGLPAVVTHWMPLPEGPNDEL